MEAAKTQLIPLGFSEAQLEEGDINQLQLLMTAKNNKPLRDIMDKGGLSKEDKERTAGQLLAVGAPNLAMLLSLEGDDQELLFDCMRKKVTLEQFCEADRGVLYLLVNDTGIKESCKTRVTEGSLTMSDILETKDSYTLKSILNGASVSFTAGEPQPREGWSTPSTPPQQSAPVTSISR